MMERICELTQPPVVGLFYLVPTVMAEWSGELGEYPVLGPKHNDRQDLKFEEAHYHIDARFISYNKKSECSDLFWAAVTARPIHEVTRIQGLTGDRLPIRDNALSPNPYLRRWTCKRLANPFVNSGDLTSRVLRAGNWQNHHSRWAGKKADIDASGQWVCPHRQVPLGSQPVRGGVVVCPLHNLHICNSSGRVLSLKETYNFYSKEHDCAFAPLRGSEGKHE